MPPGPGMLLWNDKNQAKIEHAQRNKFCLVPFATLSYWTDSLVVYSLLSLLLEGDSRCSCPCVWLGVRFLPMVTNSRWCFWGPGSPPSPQSKCNGAMLKRGHFPVGSVFFPSGCQNPLRTTSHLIVFWRPVGGLVPAPSSQRDHRGHLAGAAPIAPTAVGFEL